MKHEELQQELANHNKWLNDDGGRCANLSEANLRWASLRWANLRGANLSEANLSEANLRGANLRGANLRGANLSEANLSGADLRWADLRWANLSGADLSGADLRWADLRRGKGIFLLPVQDMRGYSFAHAVETSNGWRIRVGCQDFSIEEAKAHWGSSYTGDRQQGDMYLYAVDWLERKLPGG